MSSNTCNSENGSSGFEDGFPSPSDFCCDGMFVDNSTKREFSGGDFRSDTCTHLVINDAKWLNEYRVKNYEMIRETRYRLRGFSGDYEGICLY